MSTLAPRPKRTIRFVVEWETAKPGHMTDDSECNEHMHEQECYDWHSRAFPSMALAEAFASDPVKCPSLCGEPRICEQEWSPVTPKIGRAHV